jgi:hypothetical protein
MNPIKTAPKNRPILAWCVDECSSDCKIPGTSETNLCLFHAHAEGLSKVVPGPHVVVWGGGFDDSTWEYPNQASLPDWWFRFGSDFEEVANPTHWMDIQEPTS